MKGLTPLPVSQLHSRLWVSVVCDNIGLLLDAVIPECFMLKASPIYSSQGFSLFILLKVFPIHSSQGLPIHCSQSLPHSLFSNLSLFTVLKPFPLHCSQGLPSSLFSDFSLFKILKPFTIHCSHLPYSQISWPTLVTVLKPFLFTVLKLLSLIHISEPTRRA